MEKHIENNVHGPMGPILSKPILSKPRWATAAATTATATEEFCQAIQAPSPTHPGTTYPVRVSPHSDL